MKIGTVLVSKDGYYSGPNGELPNGRPEGDKEFITNLVRDKTVLCSSNTLENLPKSILREAKGFTTSVSTFWDINFGIDTFKCVGDLFIIIRTDENLNGGKRFRFDYIENDYDKIMDMNNILIYIKK